MISCLKNDLKKSMCEVLIVAGADMVYQAVLACGHSVKVIGMERSNPYYAYNRKKRLLNKYGYWMSDGYVFQTQGAKGYYGGKGIVIGNPISASEYAPSIDSRKKKSFCAVGRLSYAKNYTYLINLFIRLHESDGDYHLDIYGEGELKDELDKQIHKLGAEKYICLCGSVRDIEKKMTEYPYYIMCSRYEGMPNALMEAMSLGCIVFSTDFDFGPAELIENGINGFILNDDVNSLADVVRMIEDDKIDLELISDNARKYIISNYSIDAIGSKFYDYIVRFVKNRQTSK